MLNVLYTTLYMYRQIIGIGISHETEKYVIVDNPQVNDGSILIPTWICNQMPC